jgi:hypothetical protein
VTLTGESYGALLTEKESVIINGDAVRSLFLLVILAMSSGVGVGGEV